MRMVGPSSERAKPLLNPINWGNLRKLFAIQKLSVPCVITFLIHFHFSRRVHDIWPNRVSESNRQFPFCCVVGEPINFWIDWKCSISRETVRIIFLGEGVNVVELEVVIKSSYVYFFKVSKEKIQLSTPLYFEIKSIISFFFLKKSSFIYFRLRCQLLE